MVFVQITWLENTYFAFNYEYDRSRTRYKWKWPLLSNKHVLVLVIKQNYQQNCQQILLINKKTFLHTQSRQTIQNEEVQCFTLDRRYTRMWRVNLSWIEFQVRRPIMLIKLYEIYITISIKSIWRWPLEFGHLFMGQSELWVGYSKLSSKVSPPMKWHHTLHNEQVVRLKLFWLYKNSQRFWYS